MTALYTCLRATVIAGVAGSAAALLLWGLFSCVRRVSLRWQYRLWVAAGLLFLLPVRIPLPQATTRVPLGAVTVYITETATRPLPPPTAAVPQLAWGDVAALVWLLTAVGLFLYYTVRYTVATRRLRRATCVVSCPRLSEFTARRVVVRQGACVTSPLLVGLFRPTLYLPDRALDEEPLRHILAHETVHLHRGDLWVKRLCLVIRCVQWYNPAAHLVCRRIAAVCETSCDTAAIAKCGGDTAAYLGTVLSLLCEGRTTPLTTAMAGSPRRIKARFRTVSAYRPCREATVTAAVAATLVLIVALCAGGVYAGQNNAPALPSVTLPTAPPVTVEGENVPPPVEEDGGLRWPLVQTQAAVSATYGYRWGDLHRGIDIAADLLDPVVAAGDGKVIACELDDYNGGYGTTVLIDHGDGVQTLYAHLDGLAVTTGEFVRAGQTIARVGMTGIVTGPCLHFEVRVNGETVDPMAYLDVLMDEAETIVDGEEKEYVY